MGLIIMEIQFLKEERDILREESEHMSEIENLLQEKTKETRSILRQLKDMEIQLNDVHQSRTYKKNVSLKKELNNAITEINDLLSENDKMKLEFSELKRKMKLTQKGKSDFKLKFKNEKEKSDALLSTLLDEETVDDSSTLKNDRTNKYKDSVRLAYMDLQGEAGVAATKCSQVIQIVSKHFFSQEFSLKDLPSNSTSLNFADEAHHIAMHQVMDQIQKTDHFTYASDGTSRQKQHYLERHVILADKTQLSVGFTEIASDDADTLLEKTVELLHELSSIFCINEMDKKDDLFKELIKKMKCLMSDRAAVNKSFNKKMSQFRQDYLEDENVTTHFLYCNAHFLLGLAQATQDVLKAEVEKEVCKDEGCANGLGRDSDKRFAGFSHCPESAAIRLIRTASECLGPRCDEKNGSRVNWLAYCENKKIISKFSSFRNNRFNNIFENAAATLYHHHHIQDFLINANFHSNLKLQSVTADAADDRVMAMVGAVAMFNVLVTGSYWKLMNSFLPYGDFPKYVKKLDSVLEHLATHDVERISDVTSVFEDFPVEDDVTSELVFSSVHRDVWTRTLRSIASKSRCVLQRQLNDFLSGELYGDLDESTKEILDTCPLTNLAGERLFGDLDCDMMKRRNASTHNRSSIVMWKHNNTAKWLEQQGKEKKSEIMDSAVKNRKALREKHLESVKRQRQIIRDKLVANVEKMKAKEIKDAETQSTILDSIINDGGVCTTRDHLNELLANSNVEALKTQIRYRKVFKKQKLRLTGTKKELYQTLLEVIELEEENSDV